MKFIVLRSIIFWILLFNISTNWLSVNDKSNDLSYIIHELIIVLGKVDGSCSYYSNHSTISSLTASNTWVDQVWKINDEHYSLIRNMNARISGDRIYDKPKTTSLFCDSGSLLSSELESSSSYIIFSVSRLEKFFN